MSIHIVDSIEDWPAESPADSIYHTRPWIKLLAQTYAFKFYGVIARQGGQVVGALPMMLTPTLGGKRKLVSLPYSHAVPLRPESESAHISLLSAAEELAQELRAGIIEIRTKLPTDRRGWISQTNHYASLLDIDKPQEQLYMQIKASARRNVKKARRKGIEVIEGSAREHYRCFYELMLETRKRQGAPPYAFKFFQMLPELLSPENFRLYLAMDQGLPVAGIIMLFNAEVALYAYGASTSDRRHLINRPNEYLFWRSITDAQADGRKIYDFGSTPVSHATLLNYKSKWGARVDELTYSYYLADRNASIGVDRSGLAARLTSGVLKKTPIFILRHLGPFMLKRLG